MLTHHLRLVKPQMLRSDPNVLLHSNRSFLLNQPAFHSFARIHVPAKARFRAFTTSLSQYATNKNSSVGTQSSRAHEPNIGKSGHGPSWKNAKTTLEQAPKESDSILERSSFSSMKNKFKVADITKGAEKTSQYQRLLSIIHAFQKEINVRKDRKQSFLQIRADYGDMFFMQLCLVYVCGFVCMLYLVYLRGWFRLQTPLKYLNVEWLYEQFPLLFDIFSAFMLNEVLEMVVFPLLVVIHVALRA